MALDGADHAGLYTAGSDGLLTRTAVPVASLASLWSGHIGGGAGSDEVRREARRGARENRGPQQLTRTAYNVSPCLCPSHLVLPRAQPVALLHPGSAGPPTALGAADLAGLLDRLESGKHHHDHGLRGAAGDGADSCVVLTRLSTSSPAAEVVGRERLVTVEVALPGASAT